MNDVTLHVSVEHLMLSCTPSKLANERNITYHINAIMTTRPTSQHLFNSLLT